MIIAPPATRKIPTLLGLLLVFGLVAVVAFTSQAAQNVTKMFSQASTSSKPLSVNTANVTDTSFTVYWTTDQETSGAVFYGKSTGLGDGVAVDDRDLSAANGKYLTHFVRVNNLKSNVKYYYKIGVGNATFGNADKNDAPYEITTGAVLSTSPVIDPIFGKVLDLAGSPASGVIAVWEVADGGKIAALSKTDGSYVLPIGNTRTAGLESFLSPADNVSETIKLTPGGSSEVATITCKVGLGRPLPTVKLGESADCTKKTVNTANADNPTGFKTPTPSPAASPSAGVVSINVNNGQAFNTPLPTISGKAGPNQIVQIVIHSDTPYSGTVQAGPDGSWSWTPPANLSAGQHTVTITTTNPDGTTKSETRNFIVETTTPILPITSGTPSAQLTHLTCVGSTCSMVTGAGSNSCAVDSDCVATPSPTPAPTPTPAPITPPQTGSTENTLIMLTLGLIFATLGIVITFK